jgi:hypothetical protein
MRALERLDCQPAMCGRRAGWNIVSCLAAEPGGTSHRVTVLFAPKPLAGRTVTATVVHLHADADAAAEALDATELHL